MKPCVRRVLSALGRIGLVDWSLLCFLFLLLGYTFFHLSSGAAEEQGNSVDIIVRTSAAAIFGYFLSRNSLSPASPGGAGTGGSPPTRLAGPGEQPQARAQLGFSLTPGTGAPGGASSAPYPGGEGCPRFQVAVVSCIGLFSLALLFSMRGSVSDSPAMTAAVSQLRDFVSASVGFLVSCGKGNRA